MTDTSHNHEPAKFKANFHIVIVGAGLVGLATAILLQMANYKITVLEQDTELHEARDTLSDHLQSS